MSWRHEPPFFLRDANASPQFDTPLRLFASSHLLLICCCLTCQWEMRMKVSVNKVILGCVAVFALMQVVVPARTNPQSDPSASLVAVRPDAAPAYAVMQRSCGDCHSNYTLWPWYSRVAPVSWLVARDVSEGRREFNISEFGGYDAAKQQRKLDKACEEVTGGEMPMWIYTLQHPDARLRPGDVEAICSAVPTR